MGAVRIADSGGKITPVRGEPAQRLLAVLALRNGRRLSKIEVARSLWGGASSPEVSFRQALRALRQTIERAGFDAEQVLVASRGSRGLEGTATLHASFVDAIEFERLARSEERADLERALQLYESELLAYVKDPPEILLSPRARLAWLAELLHARLASMAWEEGDEPAALLHAADAVLLKPTDALARSRLVRFIDEAKSPHDALMAGERALSSAGLEDGEMLEVVEALARRRRETTGG